MSSSKVFLVFVICIGYTFAADPCPCPNPAFNVSRTIEVPDVQKQVFAVMMSKYKSGFDILRQSLAKDTIQTLDFALDNSTFVMDEVNHCMSATVKNATFLINEKTYFADFMIQGKALQEGVSTAICDCVQKDAKTADVDICKGYLFGETEKRMNVVKAIFETKKPTS